MSTKKKSNAMKFMEELVGEPLSFGMALKSSREMNNLTQQALADKAGVSRAFICDLEKGRRIPSPELAAKYARLLNDSVTQFVRLSVQDQIRRANLDIELKVVAA